VGFLLFKGLLFSRPFLFLGYIDMKLIRETELLKNFIPVSRTTLWRMVKAGQFPAPIKLRGATAWKELEIKVWLDNQGPQIEQQ
jgi:prophage regulatory protein